MKRKNELFSKLFSSIGQLTSLLFWGTITLSAISCSDNDMINNGDESERGVSVSFQVNDIQQETIARNGDEITRSTTITPGLEAIDLVSQKLDAQNTSGLDVCLIETTVEGVNPVQVEAQTRASVKTTIDGDFSSLGYRGVSAAGISSKPEWFYNQKTKSNGTLYTSIPWAWEQPYGRFYAIYPEVTNAYQKLTLSPATYSGNPYVNFEVETDVANQKDLMTACSGEVHYNTHGVAPTTNLDFRHALTAVRFAVGQNLSWNKTIDKVEIRNALYKGKYTLSDKLNGIGAVWDLSSSSARTTFTLSGVSVSTSEMPNTVIMGNSGDNYTFYMIPQTLTGNSVIAYIHCTDGTEITATLKGSWKPGTTKTYKLSQNSSTWNYILTATSPAPTAFNEITTTNYTITSYREDPGTGTKHKVKWEVVGYDANNDNIFSISEKPAWLMALSKTEGDGGTVAEQGTATVTKESTDLLAKRNKDLKAANIKGSASSYWNLSNSSGAATIQNTANSYLISAPGYYRIPLVYGNAIKGGSQNTISYQSTRPASKFLLKTFKDHKNTDITSPYINVQNANNKAIQAAVVWADAANLVSNLSVHNVSGGQDDYLQFEVTRANLQNGNAVIAVKNASGTVMWSWHLWFAPATVLQTIACTNRQNQIYSFTTEPLGWKYTDWTTSIYTKARSVKVKVRQTLENNGMKQEAVITIQQNPGTVGLGVATFYQFGRKDAFPGNSVVQGSFIENAGDNMTIQNGIQNPEKFYEWASSWYTNYEYHNLWAADNIEVNFKDIPVIKTIYDPCPVGFKMPASNAFTGFTTNGLNFGPMNLGGSWNFGHTFRNRITSPNATIYFPASGYRDEKGALRGVGSSGYYCSAMASTLFTACYLSFDKMSVAPLSSVRPGGFAVRPVSE